MHSFHTLTPTTQQNVLAKWCRNKDTVLLLETYHYEDFPDFMTNSCTFLYNHPFHLFLQSTLPVLTYIIYPDNHPPIWIHFRKAREQLISPASAPFGGFEGNNTMTSESFMFFLACMMEGNNMPSVQKNTIITPAGCYRSGINDMMNGQTRFRQEQIYQNHHIIIDQIPFLRKIAANQRRRFNKCRNFNFLVKEIPVDEKLYTFLKRCRDERGYPLSMTLSSLTQLARVFPDKVMGWGVFEKDQLICATVGIRAEQHVLYNFLPASLLQYNEFSPMVMLLDTVYAYCRNQRIAMLDLGISCDENGNEKPSLLRFKKQLGGVVSSKTTWSSTRDSLHRRSLH